VLSRLVLEFGDAISGRNFVASSVYKWRPLSTPPQKLAISFLLPGFSHGIVLVAIAVERVLCPGQAREDRRVMATCREATLRAEATGPTLDAMPCAAAGCGGLSGRELPDVLPCKGKYDHRH
jgi:hypothetical protein